ncbi:hypothetical protein [Burkholderia gladioli]|uniref:hypothetical protein n=1 Tax=Burkholderia gladioli TaxID=28095 RepID=UPI000D4CCDAB|nr:hypothetical protein [Burkholderia gladioli]POS10205.1 hypothetical protein C3Y08_01800 [Burkholderia gladioli]
MSDKANQPPPLELLIEARPEIMVGPTVDGRIEIIVNSIDENSEHVQRNSVAFPVDCAEQIAQALLRLVELDRKLIK